MNFYQPLIAAYEWQWECHSAIWQKPTLHLEIIHCSEASAWCAASFFGIIGFYFHEDDNGNSFKQQYCGILKWSKTFWTWRLPSMLRLIVKHGSDHIEVTQQLVYPLQGLSSGHVIFTYQNIPCLVARIDSIGFLLVEMFEKQNLRLPRL